MRADAASPGDWRDAAAYAPLLDADRSLFAWEWLRRDPSYRAAAHRALSQRPGGGCLPRPQQFGLVAFEPAQRAVPLARPLWRIDAHPYVLRAETATARREGDRLDLARLTPFATVVRSRSGEHLLLSDGLRVARVDGPAGAFTSRPTGLRYILDGLASAEPPLLTLRRFLALCRTGGFARSLHQREARARRWILMLRASDALAAGADQRSIAQELISASVTAPGWRSREPSIRSQAQRLVRAARQMERGGYRRLLR